MPVAGTVVSVVSSTRTMRGCADDAGRRDRDDGYQIDSTQGAAIALGAVAISSAALQDTTEGT